MRRVMAQVERVAASETRVCILGETGTGKELVARTLHERSARASAPFVTLNCAAVPAELIESELFGHEKGSFTGAAGRHLGKFEQAQHGTIFLDEIGDMPLTMQAKLLRVLEEGEVERIGGERVITVDVRVIVATHRDLEAQVRDGKFRQDLFHRVFVFPLRLPPLRERREDIPALIEHFAAQVSATNGWKPMRFTEGAMTALQRAVVAGQRPRTQERRRTPDVIGHLRRSHCRNRSVGVARFSATSDSASAASGPLADRVRAFEKQTILAELKRNHHQISNTARALGLERSHLYKKAEQVGIDLKAAKNEGDR